MYKPNCIYFKRGACKSLKFKRHPFLNWGDRACVEPEIPCKFRESTITEGKTKSNTKTCNNNRPKPTKPPKIGRQKPDEYLLCSAIWFDDGKKHIHRPVNLKSGFVICGRRHHNCFATIKSLSEFLEIEDPIANYKTHLSPFKDKIVQGFLTNINRFVDRSEAHIIAEKAGQVDKITGKPHLISEMVW